MEAEVQKSPCISPGIKMTNQYGKKVDVAAELASRHALLAFGAAHSAGDVALQETIAK